MTEATAAIVGAIVGGIIAFICTFFSVKESRSIAIESINITEFNRASAILRASFAPAMVKLSLPRELGNIEVRKFFDDAFLLHAAAVEEFRPFASDRVAYQKAYEEYRKALYEDDALGDADIRWSSGMMGLSEDGKETIDFLNFISEKIANILHFASPK
jgi:hypothetical protein